jgi:Rrf2 family protein
MRITTQGDYALRCLLNIACRSDKGAVSISRIVEEEGLPQDYIEQLLMKLRRHKLIKSVRGVNGGYLLDKSTSDITVKDVLIAVEGEAFEVICARRNNANKKSCRRDKCVLKTVWLDLKATIDSHLDKITIKDLALKQLK